MIKYVAIFSLAYSAINWLFFAWSALARPIVASPSNGLNKVELQGFDPEKILTGAGSLASAFKAAGATATAAAMSLVGLVIAAVAAGIDKFYAN